MATPKTRSEIFETALEKFIKSTKASMEAAVMCARCSIEQFKEHGDLSMAQKFYDAMPVNFTRKNSFRMWLVNWAPVEVKDGKFVKDPNRKEMVIDVEAACKLAFYDDQAAPKEPFNYSADYIVEQAQRLITRLENHKRYKPTDHAAEIRLNQFKQAVTNLIALPLPEGNEQPEEEQADTSTEEGAEKAA